MIWSVADLRPGDYKQSEYGKVILSVTVIRRLNCVLESTKAAVVEKHRQLANRIENLEPVLQAVSGEQFWIAWTARQTTRNVSETTSSTVSGGTRRCA